jgi:ABC-type uncharacterized transport system ATPase subunit
MSLDNKIAAVKMRNITKRFGSVLANDKVWLDIYRGEILALLGENGSGKTTLMNMLAGIYYPDSGEIRIDGKPVSISSPREAFDLGIGMIHQHFKLVDVFTAAENIVLGLKDEGRYDIKKAAKKIREISEQYGFGYVKALAQTFYGIKDTALFKAQGLDIYGADINSILKRTMREIDSYFLKGSEENGQT